MLDRFYESLKLKKWMCELCTFSQIRSHMLLAPIKEKKVTHQAWIKVFTAGDYPNVFPQLILIRALSLC